MTEKKKRFFESLYEIFDREKGRKLQMYEIIDLLNEQHSLINALKKENKELKEELEKGFDVPIPYVENSLRRLRAEHKVDEQQATLSDLKEENEQLRKELKGLNRKYIAFSEATDKRLKEMMK